MVPRAELAGCQFGCVRGADLGSEKLDVACVPIAEGRRRPGVPDSRRYIQDTTEGATRETDAKKVRPGVKITHRSPVSSSSSASSPPSSNGLTASW